MDDRQDTEETRKILPVSYYNLTENCVPIFSINSTRTVCIPHSTSWSVDDYSATYERFRNPGFPNHGRRWLGLLPFSPTWSGVFFSHLETLPFPEGIESKRNPGAMIYFQLPNATKELWLRLDAILEDLITSLLSFHINVYGPDAEKCKERPPYLLSLSGIITRQYTSYEKCRRAIDKAREWFVVLGTYARWLLDDVKKPPEVIAHSIHFPLEYLASFRSQAMFSTEQVGFFLDSTNYDATFVAVLKWCWTSKIPCFFIWRPEMWGYDLPAYPTEHSIGKGLAKFQGRGDLVEVSESEGNEVFKLPAAILSEIKRREHRQRRDRRSLFKGRYFIINPDMVNDETLIRVWDYDTNENTYKSRRVHGREPHTILLRARKGATIWNRYENSFDILLQETLDRHFIESIKADEVDTTSFPIASDDSIYGNENLHSLDTVLPDASDGGDTIDPAVVNDEDTVEAIQNRIGEVDIPQSKNPVLSYSSFNEALSSQLPSNFSFSDKGHFDAILKYRFGFITTDEMSPNHTPTLAEYSHRTFDALLLRLGVNRNLSPKDYGPQFTVMKFFSDCCSLKPRDILQRLDAINYGGFDLAKASGRHCITPAVKTSLHYYDTARYCDHLSRLSTSSDTRGTNRTSRVYIDCDDSEDNNTYLFATSAVDALHCYRYLQANSISPSIFYVCKFFLDNGIRFHMTGKLTPDSYSNLKQKPGSHPSRSSFTKTITFSQARRRWSYSEFLESQARATATLQHHRHFIAARRGGIVWRLTAMLLGLDISLSGQPLGTSLYTSETITMIGPDGSYFVDEILTTDEVITICGGYKVLASGHDDHVISWWPLPTNWEQSSGKNIGLWTTTDESWFRQHNQTIINGNATPLNSRQWDTKLQTHGTQKELKGISRISDAVLFS